MTQLLLFGPQQTRVNKKIQTLNNNISSKTKSLTSDHSHGYLTDMRNWKMHQQKFSITKLSMDGICETDNRYVYESLTHKKVH